VLAVLDLAEEVGPPGFAFLQRPQPPVFTVKYQELEGIEKHLAVAGPAVQLGAAATVSSGRA
jgi:hypothetical protein